MVVMIVEVTVKVQVVLVPVLVLVLDLITIQDTTILKGFFSKNLKVSETEEQLLSFRYKVEALIFKCG